MLEDPFRHAVENPIAPADNCFAIVPDDVLELARATKGIYVGSGGNVTVRSVRGAADVTFVNVPDGAVLDIRVRAVRASGTTATNIVGLA